MFERFKKDTPNSAVILEQAILSAASNPSFTLEEVGREASKARKLQELAKKINTNFKASDWRTASETYLQACALGNTSPNPQMVDYFNVQYKEALTKEANQRFTLPIRPFVDKLRQLDLWILGAALFTSVTVYDAYQISERAEAAVDKAYPEISREVLRFEKSNSNDESNKGDDIDLRIQRKQADLKQSEAIRGPLVFQAYRQDQGKQQWEIFGAIAGIVTTLIRGLYLGGTSDYDGRFGFKITKGRKN